MGCTLLAKLRAILLMEADFNHFNREIFEHRMLVNAREYRFMPEEVYSERGKVPYDGTLPRLYSMMLLDKQGCQQALPQLTQQTATIA